MRRTKKRGCAYIGKVLLTFFVLAFFSQCKVEVNQGVDDYSMDIYRWFSEDYKKLQDSGGEWYLYFDDQITCNTCKLDILSKVKNESNLWLITRFESNAKLEAFKSAYKLQNRIINLDPNQNFNLHTPFIFHLDGNSLKDLVILKDEELAEGNWLEIFHNLN
jgi:hypothetical protein